MRDYNTEVGDRIIGKNQVIRVREFDGFDVAILITALSHDDKPTLHIMSEKSWIETLIDNCDRNGVLCLKNEGIKISKHDLTDWRIEHVRSELWSAYKWRSDSGKLDGKSEDGRVSVIYPAWYECETRDEFLSPIAIGIYSYDIGPSRMHYVWDSRYRNKEPEDYRNYHSPNICRKAVEVIQQWVADLKNMDLDTYQQ